MTRWGLVATVLAPTVETLRFAAYHLSCGAHRLYIYLDAENAEAYAALKSHPKIRVQTCDAAFWNKLTGTKPARHQVRQAANATRTYNRKAEVDWLIHMDVDEFLVPDETVADVLATSQDHCLRVRPMEQLGDGDGTAFKAFLPPGPKRQQAERTLYPTFGQHLRGGFLSHVAGKVFVRTGLADVELRIHNAFQAGVMHESAEMPQIDLAHCHARSWEKRRAAFDYRLDRGSYRSEIKPNRPTDQGGVSIHDLLGTIAASEGEDGLRAFYDEVIGDSAHMRARLADLGLLRHVTLDLDALLTRHFPDFKGV